MCARCGNHYDKSFEITTADGETKTFDSFECAIASMAPRCEGCGLAIIGHGMEQAGQMFCCRNCAAQVSGETPLQDRA
jgi:hypothetical protein